MAQFVGSNTMGTLQVQDLRLLSRQLKAVDAGLQKEMVKAYKLIAVTIKSASDERAKGIGGIVKGASKHTAVSATTSGANIVLQRRNSLFPWVAAAEFGSPLVMRRVATRRRTIEEQVLHDAHQKLRGKKRAEAVINYKDERPYRLFLGWKQFEEYRGNGETAGYFIYPTIRAKTGYIKDQVGRVTDEFVQHTLKES